MDFNDEIVFAGGINTDDDARNVPKGDYRDFSYCRLGNVSGTGFSVVTSWGTVQIPNGGIYPQDKVLGATFWEKQNAIVFFVFKADGNHQIKVYYISTETVVTAVTSSVLNFSLEWPIYHANVIDDILKWTDGRWNEQMYTSDGSRLFNPPYQINLQKALDGYYTTIDLRTIDAIKWPMDPPRVSYFTDPTRQDNKLRNKLFKFIIQPIYENGEIGVWSMYSNLDLPEQSELVTGTNWVYLNNSNGIKIQFFTGPKIICKFNIAVQQFDKNDFGTEPPFGVFLQLDKTQDNIADNIYHTIDFYGGAATAPAIDVLKNYDRLPIIADCQEYLPTSQLTYVNFREGYNKPTEEYEILNVQVDYELNEISWTGQQQKTITCEFRPTGFFNSLYINTLYQFVPPNTLDSFPFAAGELYSLSVPPSNQLWSYQLTFTDIQTALAEPTVIDQVLKIYQILGDSLCTFLGIPLGYPTSESVPGATYYYYRFNTSLVLELTVASNLALNQTQSTPSLKSGATHEFGIVYGDRAYRDSTVYTVGSMNLFVPWFYDIDRSGLSNQDDPFTISPRFTINHIPPVWADRYWIVAKPATEILSFGQYTTNSNEIKPVPIPMTYASSISLDQQTKNRYIIQLDNYYETQNIGAKIRHQIKIGDKIRFIRKRPNGGATDASFVPYLPYLELDVIDYNPSGGENGRQQVYTNLFDTTLIDADVDAVGNFLFGQLLEIYTPRPSTDDTGSIFVSAWKDISQSLPIINPHTPDRAHGAAPLYYVSVARKADLSAYYFYLPGDQSFLDGTAQNYTLHYNDGTSVSGATDVTSAIYNPLQNITFVTLFGITPFGTMAYLTFDGTPQDVNNLVSFRGASFPLSYGDVYVRQRNYQTGLTGGDAVYYYYIEDPNYSDYWSSDVHSTGRFRIEDQNAKMSHRKAVAIHSDSYIVGTQINGLSSFSLANDNIEEMNSLYGGVVRVYMSGREGKTLKCLQPKKENSIYIQFYPNEVGSDSTVRVSGRTFASWFDYRSLYGCTNAGATALLPDGSTMYFDNNSGVFVLSQSNGQSVVSEIDPDSGKDFKFRAKTKQLAKKYNEDPLAVVRTYVNETMGEVGFAFRFGGLQGVGETAYEIGRPDPYDSRMWKIPGSVTDILNTTVRIYEENGQITYGLVTKAIYDSVTNYTYIEVNDNGPTTTGVAMTWYSDYNVEYDHVVFDYVNLRWRSTYDYSFSQFAHFGQTLIGWNDVNQMFIHNQETSVTFHDQPFIQKISFVSNENPFAIKRYQDFTQRANKKFSVKAYSEPNKSYPKGMYTEVPATISNLYEGYTKGYYRKNLYDPRFYSTGTTTLSVYNPGVTNGWTIPGDYSGILGINIIIVQGNTNFIGNVTSSSYDNILDVTSITLSTGGPNEDGITGFWYKSDLAMLNGEDIRAYAVTHELTYDPSIDVEGSVLSTVGITGVLS